MAQNRFGRRTILKASAAVGAGALMPGCDGGAMIGPDAGPPMPDAGPPPPPDAGRPEPVPPAPRTYATFEHGVASGDPLATSVILWTHVTYGGPTTPEPESIEVRWEVARDATFGDIVANDTTSTDASRDWTVKVEPTGLEPGSTYYYRFSALGDVSPLGRTRTAPEGTVDQLRFAFCSCSSLAHGWFHGYRRIGQRADLDAVIHLGDYLYEYGTSRYGALRAYEPSHEIVSLSDYRLRYSQYRRDPDLQEAHRQHPFICVWDDHETTDNSWSGGAENHQPDEGPWSERLRVARQAYHEWLPIREDAEGRLWRQLQYGDLVDLLMLDTRIWGREEQGTEPEQLLGADQEAWLFERLRTSTSQWKIIGQQVVMAQWEGLPNDDAWDGYPGARARLFEVLQEVEDVVVLTGDVHSSWAMDLVPDPEDETAYDPETGRGSLGVELVTPGITSPGFIGLQVVVDLALSQNRHMMWAEGERRGYVVIDVTPARVQADWMHLETVADRDNDAEQVAVSFVTERGGRHLVPAPAALMPRSGASALAP